MYQKIKAKIPVPLLILLLLTMSFFLLFPSGNKADTSAEKVSKNKDIQFLETKLPKVTGNEKVTILRTLIKRYRDIDPHKSIQYGQEALELLSENQNLKKEGMVRCELSLNYCLLGDYRQALAEGEMSALLAQKCNDDRTRAHAYVCMANAYSNMTDYDKCIEYAFKSLALAEKIGNKALISRAYGTLGNVNSEMGKYETALDFYKKESDLARKAGDKLQQAKTLGNIGVIYERSKNSKEAIVYYLKALNLFRELKNRRAVAISLSNIAIIHQNSGKSLQAIRYYHESLEIFREMDDKRSMAIVFSNLAVVYRQTGQLQKALDYIHKALNIAETLNSTFLLKNFYEELFYIYVTMKKPEQALKNHEKYKELSNKIFSETNNKKIAELQAKYIDEKKEREKENEILLQLKENENQRNLITFLVVVLGLVLLLGTLINSRYKTKMKAAAKLEKSEAKYRTLFSGAGDAIFLLKEEIIHDCNQMALQLLNLTKEDIVGHSIFEFTPEFQYDGANSQDIGRERIKNVLAGEPQHFHWSQVRKNGELFEAKVSLNTVDVEGEKIIQAIVHDFTDQIQLEEERLKRAKLESIGILAGGIAQDFNNLLAVINGNILLAKMQCKPTDKLFKTLSTVENTTEKATQLANKFVTFSGGGTPIKKAENLIDILQNYELLGLNNSDDIQENINVPIDLPEINCDKEQMERVFINLINNAKEAVASKNGKKVITITATVINLAQNQVPPLKEGKYIKISVIDNGTGINEENMPKIFDPYFTTKDIITQDGQGLGLSIVHSVIKQHGGTVTVFSERGKGTAVNIYLPLH